MLRTPSMAQNRAWAPFFRSAAASSLSQWSQDRAALTGSVSGAGSGFFGGGGVLHGRQGLADDRDLLVVGEVEEGSGGRGGQPDWGEANGGELGLAHLLGERLQLVGVDLGQDPLGVFGARRPEGGGAGRERSLDRHGHQAPLRVDLEPGGQGSERAAESEVAPAALHHLEVVAEVAQGGLDPLEQRVAQALLGGWRRGGRAPAPPKQPHQHREGEHREQQPTHEGTQRAGSAGEDRQVHLDSGALDATSLLVPWIRPLGRHTWSGVASGVRCRSRLPSPFSWSSSRSR